MTRRIGRVLVAALVGVAGISAPLAAAGPASADPVAQCTTRTGVLVAVDFRHFGGDITRGCDATPTTGLDALHAAGYSTQGTQHDGPAFVCRIDNHPSPAQDACFTTPPASAYWSYWHADSGQNRWTYATTGAQSYRPTEGSVDAWVFGATSLSGSNGGPTFTPDQVRNPANRPTPARTTAPMHRPATSSAGAPRVGVPAPARPGVTTTDAAPRDGVSTAPSGRVATAGSGRASASSSSRARGSSNPASGPASTSAGGSAGTSVVGTAPASAAPTVLDATPAASRADNGSPLPLVIGLVIVLALAAGGGWTVYRRRQADGTSV